MTKHMTIRRLLVTAAVFAALVGGGTAAGGEANDPASHPASADAADRWSQDDYRDRVELCSDAPSSADAIERCMAAADD